MVSVLVLLSLCEPGQIGCERDLRRPEHCPPALVPWLAPEKPIVQFVTSTHDGSGRAGEERQAFRLALARGDDSPPPRSCIPPPIRVAAPASAGLHQSQVGGAEVSGRRARDGEILKIQILSNELGTVGEKKEHSGCDAGVEVRGDWAAVLRGNRCNAHQPLHSPNKLLLPGREQQ